MAGVPTSEVVRPATAALAGAALTRASWPAIFAGVVLVLAIEVLLAMLGAGVGLGLVKPNPGQTPGAGSFGMGAGLWWFGSTIVAFVLGSCIAARLAGVATRLDGVLHGLVIWGLALLITIYLLATAIGGVIGGAFSVLGGTLSAAGQGLESVAPQIASAAGVTPDVIERQAQAYLQPNNPNPAAMSPQDAQKEIARLVPNLAAGGNRAGQAKDRIITIMAAQLKISRDEAAKRFDEVQSRLTKIKTEVAQGTKYIAAKSASGASLASLLAFAAMLIGAIAAAIGGALASPRPLFFARRVDVPSSGGRVV